MKFFFQWLLAMLAGLTMQAQTISGHIRDDEGNALTGATIALKKSADSAVVKLSVTNDKGRYQFQQIPTGKYLLHISYIGYDSLYSPVPELKGNENLDLADIMLVKSGAGLKSVTVVGKKPMIEVKADRTILNVEGSINAVGQDALELLRKSPGVLVDRDDNLSLSGKNGVQVYIDGRPSPLSGKDLSEYLKTLQSSSIEAIEIITNPSAKYEAAGNAGIINIRLKKNKSFGTNGSVNAGYNIGQYPKYNGGLSLNNRNKKTNLFANYNYNNNIFRNHMFLYRKQLDTLFDQKNKMTFHGRGHNFKAGLDYFINSRNTVGFMVNGNLNDNSFENSSRTSISYIPTGDMVKILTADNTNSGERKHGNLNLNYRFADTSGQELNIDADYGIYRIRTDQFQPNVYLDPLGDFLESRIYNMLAPTNIDIYSLKADHERNFKKGKLGLGFKVSYVESDNDFQRFNVVTGIKKLDTLRSNAFAYKENINAVYGNYNRQFKGFMVQAGLRIENTHAEGISNGFKANGTGYLTYDSGFNRNYTDFFPSAAFTLNKNPKSQLTFTYSRRIDRPAYQDLNPFEFKLDEYTYSKGNTELRPQYTNSVGVSHTYNFKLTTAVNYSHVKDVFTQLIDTAELSKAFITKKNLATQDITSLNISYPLTVKWYSLFANLNAYYSHFKADLGIGRKVDLDVFAYNIYMQHSAKLEKGWTIELSGFYNSPSIWQGTFKSKAIYGIDGGIQKSLLEGKANIKVSVSDIFRTMKWGGESNFAGQYLRTNGHWESRQFRLNITYRFGSAQIKAARQRKTGLDEESKRVGSQGGGISN